MQDGIQGNWLNATLYAKRINLKSESDCEHFEGSGVLVTQAKVIQTAGLAGLLLKIKVQHYYIDFTLYPLCCAAVLLSGLVALRMPTKVIS